MSPPPEGSIAPQPIKYHDSSNAGLNSSSRGFILVDREMLAIA
jgi:hypothetical protein